MTCGGPRTSQGSHLVGWVTFSTGVFWGHCVWRPWLCKRTLSGDWPLWPGTPQRHVQLSGVPCASSRAPQHWKLSPWPRPCSPGLTQYSGDAQTEWNLNSFGTKEQVLAAVHRLRYKGGNTFTGTAQAAPRSILRADLLLPPSQTLGACV